MASPLDTPTAVAAGSHSFAVSAGNQRCLIVGLTCEGSQSGDHTCTYGGQTMQLVVSEIAGGATTQQTVSLFYLNDAGIEAASGTTITPGNVPGDISIHAASYQDAMQTTPTNTDTDFSNAATPNPLAALDIVTGAADAVVCALSGMGNAGSASWATPLTERTDQPTASANGSFADDEVPAATTIACECTWSNQNRAAAVALELEHDAGVGISSINPTDFRMDNADIDVVGSGFGASQGTGSVYLSDANTLAGSPNEVDITSAVNTWADALINLDLTQLSAGELASLHGLGLGTGLGQRFVIVVTDASDEYGSAGITLRRPKTFVMSLGLLTPGTTTARLTGMTGTFAGGRAEEAVGQNPSTTNTDVADNGNREELHSIEATTGARVAGDATHVFRMLYGGNVPDTITQTPTVTVASGPPAQTLVATRYADPDTFPGGALALGPVTLAGTLYADPDAFAGGTIAASIDLAGTLYADPDAFPGGTIAASIDLGGTLYADPDAFLGGDLLPGPVALSATLHADPDAFPGGAVAAGPVTLAATLHIDPDIFPGGVILSGNDLTGTLYVDPDTFPGGTLLQDQTLAATLYADPDAFPGGAIAAAIDLVATLYADPDAFAGGAIAASIDLGATLYADPDAFAGGTVQVGATTLVATIHADPDVFAGGNIFQSGGPQTLIASLHADPDGFPGGTIAASIDLAGTLHADPDGFPGGTIAASIELAATNYADPDAFPGGTIAQGAAPTLLTGTLYTDPDAFPGGTIAAGGVTLVAATHADPDIFPGGTIATGIALAATLHVNASAFPGAAVKASIALAASRYADPDAFPGGTITVGGVTIISTIHVDPDQFHGGAVFEPRRYTITTTLGLAREVSATSSAARIVKAPAPGPAITTETEVE